MVCPGVCDRGGQRCSNEVGVVHINGVENNLSSTLTLSCNLSDELVNGLDRFVSDSMDFCHTFTNLV